MAFIVGAGPRADLPGSRQFARPRCVTHRPIRRLPGWLAAISRESPQALPRALVAALSAFEDLDRRFRDDPDPAIRREVAQALFRKGEALRQDGRQDQADAAMDAIVARYNDDTDPLLVAVTALAQSRKTSAPGD